MMRFGKIAVVAVLFLVALANPHPRAREDRPTGIDVSSHDHSGGRTIDWSGLAFAYVKATEGTTYVNPYFHADYHAAKDAGVLTGAYVFARPDYPDVVAQADFLVDTMEWAADGKTIPPMVDLEWPYFPMSMCYGLTPEQMVGWIKQFVERVEARIGRAPTIYTNVNWWNPCTGNSSAFARYPLDISSCNIAPPAPPGWGDGWTFWQFDIPGCGRGSSRDSDVFHGSSAELAVFAGASPSHSPSTSPSESVSPSPSPSPSGSASAEPSVSAPALAPSSQTPLSPQVPAMPWG